MKPIKLLLIIGLLLLVSGCSSLPQDSSGELIEIDMPFENDTFKNNLSSSFAVGEFRFRGDISHTSEKRIVFQCPLNESGGDINVTIINKYRTVNTSLRQICGVFV